MYIGPKALICDPTKMSPTTVSENKSTFDDIDLSSQLIMDKTEFDSWSDLDSHILNVWEKQMHHPIRKRDSQTRENHNLTAKTSKNSIIPERFKYKRVSYACSHGIKKRMRGTGKRPTQHYRDLNCPFKFRAAVDRNEENVWKVMVKSSTLYHNHPLGENMKNTLRGQKRRPPVKPLHEATPISFTSTGMGMSQLLSDRHPAKETTYDFDTIGGRQSVQSKLNERMLEKVAELDAKTCEAYMHVQQEVLRILSDDSTPPSTQLVKMQSLLLKLQEDNKMTEATEDDDSNAVAIIDL